METNDIVTVTLSEAQKDYFRYIDEKNLMKFIRSDWKITQDKIVIESDVVPIMVDYIEGMCFLRGRYFRPMKKFLKKLKDR